MGTTLIHRAARTSAPVQIVLISAASHAGKTFVLRQLARRPSFAGVETFEMDSMWYWKADLLEAGIVPARERFEEWLCAQAPSALLADIADDVRGSSPVHEIIKMKLVELASGVVPVVTVNPETTRHDARATRFLRMLEEHRGVRIRHVLLHPTRARYRLNLRRRPLPERDRIAERHHLYARRRDFDGVLRIGLFCRERTVERFFHEQLK
jgi:hypothetical protein